MATKNTTENIAAETNLKLTTPSDREIAMTRVFDAPRSQVFDAFTRPEVLKRYFATPGWSLVVCESLQRCLSGAAIGNYPSL